MNFELPPAVRALQRKAEFVAADAVHRYGGGSDPWISGYCPAFSKELGSRGWIGMTWPEEYGGGGRSPLERFVVTEALIRAGAPVAAHWFADRQVGPTLLAYGTEEQKRRYLAGIVAGTSEWCIGMSEPDAGSDLASLATRAVRHADRFVINGRKIWTSSGATAEYCYLICRTGPEPSGHRGISEIIVPMVSDGITVRPIRDLTGRQHFCEVFFEDVDVPADNLVGVEGASFTQTMRQLEHERGGIDRLLSNYWLYQRARRSADCTDPLVRQEIARLEAAYRLGRILVLRGTLHPGAPGFSAVTKAFCTEHEQRVARFAAAVFGPWSTLWKPETEAFAYHPAYTIMGGTAEVLRTVIGDRALGLPR